MSMCIEYTVELSCEAKSSEILCTLGICGVDAMLRRIAIEFSVKYGFSEPSYRHSKEGEHV
jgi:hypothetical protein